MVIEETTLLGASEIGESLTVYIQFMVDKDGSIYDVKIRRSNMPMVNAEAERVVRDMPNWIPGRHNGKPVKVIMTLPIKIQFQ